LNQKKLPVYSEFALAHFDLNLSTQCEKETRYIQYAAGEVYEIRDCNIQLVGIVYIAKAKVHLPQTWKKLWGFGYSVLSYLVFLLSKINICL
jgi:hypothetical protein